MELEFEKKESIGILRIKERLDSRSHHDFEKKFKSYLKEANQFVFDLTEMDFIDSTGLGSLVGCLKSVSDIDGDIVLANPTQKTKMVFDITRVYRIFDVFDTLDSAVQKLTAR